MLFRPRRFQRKTLITPLLAFTLLVATPSFLIAAPTTAVSSQAATASAYVQVIKQRINLRSGPGTSYAVLGTAGQGEQLSVIGRNSASSWYKVTNKSNQEVWVAASVVKLFGTAAQIAIVAANQTTTVAGTTAVVSATVTTTVATTVAAVAPTPAPTVAPTPTTPPPAAGAAPTVRAGEMAGRLLYSIANQEADRWELWEYNFANSDNRKVADWRTEVDVSPDGSQITYFAWPNDAGEEKAGTWIMDANFSNNRLLVPGGAYASFSPGGDRLVLNGGDTIFVISSDAKSINPLTRGEYPSWSPANDQIVHRACVGGGCGLWLIDANSTDPNARSRVTTGGSDGQAAWSPNGQRLAYISQDDGNFEIYAVNSDGSNKVRLTNSPSSDGLPVWSPDGNWIAFRSDRGGSWAVYVMRADGSDVRKVVDANVLPLWFFEKMDWRR